MSEKLLTHEQNIRAALVFLNVFGLRLDLKDEINNGDTLKVYDSTNTEVGAVTISSNKVNISTNCPFGKLTASYDHIAASGFVDAEDKDKIAYFAQWCSKINYTLDVDHEKKITGDFLISASLDTEFGIKCLVCPILHFFVNDINTANLFMQRNGKIFSLELLNDDTIELIEIDPFIDFGNYIRHVTKKKYDNINKGYPYIKSSSVAVKSEVENNKLRFLKYEKKFDKYLDYNQIVYDKKAKRDDKEMIIQVGSIMQEEDKDMYTKIKELRNFLSSENVSLFDNLVCISFANYDDDEVMALLGLERISLNYQDGALDLNEAYFGPCGKNKFGFNDSKVKKLYDPK